MVLDQYGRMRPLSQIDLLVCLAEESWPIGEATRHESEMDVVEPILVDP